MIFYRYAEEALLFLLGSASTICHRVINGRRVRSLLKRNVDRRVCARVCVYVCVCVCVSANQNSVQRLYQRSIIVFFLPNISYVRTGAEESVKCASDYGESFFSLRFRYTLVGADRSTAWNYYYILPYIIVDFEAETWYFTDGVSRGGHHMTILSCLIDDEFVQDIIGRCA
jgi:hypothetical protein